jgi:hypothetical protein
VIVALNDIIAAYGKHGASHPAHTVNRINLPFISGHFLPALSTEA